MFFDIDKFDKTMHLYAAEEDLCYLCTNLEECPLIAALKEEAVVLRYENVEVENCGMYKEFCFDEMIAF